jgi:prevent-host-death family protein
MTIYMGAREARSKFADILGRVHYSGETVIVERSGKPMVAMIPVELFEKLIAERDTRFAILDRLREKLPIVPEEEVAEDVAAAIAAVRSHR